MIVVGSAAGAERHPAWVLNLIANPRVIVHGKWRRRRSAAGRSRL
jgi:hypothetical protein